VEDSSLLKIKNTQDFKHDSSIEDLVVSSLRMLFAGAAWAAILLLIAVFPEAEAPVRRAN